VIDAVHLLLAETATIRLVTDGSNGCVDHSVRTQGLTNDALGELASEGFTHSPVTFGTVLSSSPATRAMHESTQTISDVVQ
jgi:hypothetical protein